MCTPESFTMEYNKSVKYDKYVNYDQEGSNPCYQVNKYNYKKAIPTTE